MSRTAGRVAGRLVGGLDGCRAGWVLVTLPADGAGADAGAGAAADAGAEVLDLSSPRDLDEPSARSESGRLAAAAIDIPIGLPRHGPRARATARPGG